MADSNITASALAATAAIGHINLTWAYSDPNADGLPYLKLDAIEVWAASSNNRSGASKVGEGLTFFGHTVTAGATRFYWIKARNASGNYGDWYPLSATAGVSATSGTAVPGPNSITTSQIADSAVTPTKMSVSSLSAITANIGTITAGSVSGVTFTGNSFVGGTFNGGTFVGAIFQTGSSGRRVEITATTNAIISYNSSNVQVGRLGQSSGSSTVLELNGGGLSPTASITNASFGAALSLTNSSGGDAITANQTSSFGAGFAVSGISSNSSAVAGQFIHNSTSSHAIRGKNFGTSGGSGLLGVGQIGGGYGVYSEIGGYGPFTGAHDALIRKDDPAGIGYLVADVRLLGHSSISDTIFEVESSASEGQRGVVGVISNRIHLLPTTFFASGLDASSYVETHDRVTINALGEGMIFVIGAVERGDLLVASSTPGKAIKQADDVVRSNTVARTREASSGGLVACIYLSG